MNWSRNGRGMGNGKWERTNYTGFGTGSGLKQDNRVSEIMVGGSNGLHWDTDKE